VQLFLLLGLLVPQLFSGETMPKNKKPTDPNAPQEPGTLIPAEKRFTGKVSKQTHRLLDQIVAAAQSRQYEEQEQVVGLRPLILCGIPLRRHKESYYQRQNGPFKVEFISHPKVGVPYGQDRLIPIFLATLFSAMGCPEDNRIRFLYARDILRLFDLPENGAHYKRLKEGFMRWRKTLVIFESRFVTKRGKIGRRDESCVLIPESRLWYQGDDTEDTDEIPNEICLDSHWADEIRKHPIPIDLQTVKALAAFPGALDFYCWQIWRCYCITEQTRVPFGGPTGLFAQIGCLEGQETKELKRLLKRWQIRIKSLWPECPNFFGTDGKSFVLRPAKALKTLQANRFLLQVIRTAQGKPTPRPHIPGWDD
jgi:hypothetical protein